MAKKKELFLEEAVLDDLAQEFDSLELPLSERAFRLMLALVFLVGAVVAGDVVFLGWWKQDFWSERALVNASQITTLRAERGVILDRFGEPLSQNLPSFRLNIKLSELLKDEKERGETFDTLESILGLSDGYIEDLVKNVNLERQNVLTIARQVSVEQVIRIKNLNLSGVQIENDFARRYPEGEIFSHLIGYVGPVDKNDLTNDPSLSLNEIIGKSGLEAYYDKELRGEDGEIINYRNAKGEIIGEKLLKNPAPGQQLYSTIDAEFQTYFYNRLKQGLDFVGSRAGVGIAINPQNGEVLAMVNLPSFDNNKIKSEDLVNPWKPLFNRAIAGTYPPGSTIKPLVATAALKENIITPEKEIYSAGYIEIPNPYDAEHPSRFLDWRPHGWVDLYSALARSSNVYFYIMGGGLPSDSQPRGILRGFENPKGLGIEKLKQYWQKFGLGERTSIDLPSENKGFLPDPSTKEKSTKEIWRIGDTYNVSIGQGDLLVTPLQLLNCIAIISNGGKIYKPFVAKKIVDAEGKVIKETQAQVVKDFSAELGGEIEEVQKGMIDAVSRSYGTAYSLADLGFPIAAKTGTAQIEANTKINALFVGYTPTDKPELAVLVLIENAREGSLNAVPVAKDVLRWYYWNRIANRE
jgi:penicillin-binding protein 2